jgi:hypothetical protein
MAIDFVHAGFQQKIEPHRGGKAAQFSAKAPVFRA